MPAMPRPLKSLQSLAASKLLQPMLREACEAGYIDLTQAESKLSGRHAQKRCKVLISATQYPEPLVYLS